MDAGVIFGLWGLGIGIVLMICEAIWPDPNARPGILTQMNYDPSDDND